MSLNLNDIVTDGSVKFQVVKSATNLDVSEEIAQLKNELGYRKPNISYTAGQIAYHSSLPTRWYLECTTAGISGNNDLTINNPTIGSTINDGTVTWIISCDLDVLGGTINGNLNINGNQTLDGNLIIGGFFKCNVSNKYITICGSNNSSDSAYIQVYGKDYTPSPGWFQLIAKHGTNSCGLIGKPQRELMWAGNDLAGAAIQAKSLGTNGYIKYASGLIIQKIYISIENTDLTGVSAFPISFSSSIYAAAYCCFDTTAASNDTCSIIGISNTQISWKRSTNYYGINIIAIGY